MKSPFVIVTVSVLTLILSADFASGQVLTHGPVVGGVTASNAKVFVRTDVATSVVLRYGTDPNLATYLSTATFQTKSSNDFTKTIPLAGLSSQTIYYLEVVVNGVRQFQSPPYPSFTTFPSSGTSRDFNFVVLSDFAKAKKLTDTVQTFASAAADSPAFAFIGGDFDHRNPLSLSTKRRMFKDNYNADSPYLADFVNLILWKTPIVHHWDDHDSGANNIDKTYTNWNMNQKVFEEYMPSYPLPSVKPAIWQKFSYAQAECFVLDCRSQRDPGTDPDGPSKSMLDGNNLGASGQLRWLKNGLLASTARWKIIFTSVIINPTTKFPDGWAAYQTEWNALKSFINANNISGVVFISGDLHLGAIDNGVHAGFPEMCIASANGPEFKSRCSSAAPGRWSEGFYSATCNGYGLVTVLKNPDRLILQVADQHGNIHISYTVF